MFNPAVKFRCSFDSFLLSIFLFISSTSDLAMLGSVHLQSGK
jgi:hypothetical protein